MKEIKHEVITQCTPTLENMPKEVFNVFCKSILDVIIAKKEGKEKLPPQKDGNLLNDVDRNENYSYC